MRWAVVLLVALQAPLASDALVRSRSRPVPVAHTKGRFKDHVHFITSEPCVDPWGDPCPHQDYAPMKVKPLPTDSQAKTRPESPDDSEKPARRPGGSDLPIEASGPTESEVKDTERNSLENVPVIGPAFAVHPVSTTMKCVISLTAQYIIVYTALAVIRTI